MDTSVLFLTSFILSYLTFLFFYLKKEKFDFFSPYFLYPIIFFIYSYAGILFYNEYQSDIFGNYLGENIGLKYLQTCLIGLFGFYFGFYFVSKYKIQTKIIPSVNKKVFNYFIIFYCILSLIVNFNGIYSQFDIFHIKSYGDISFDSRINLRNNKEEALIEILFQTTPIFLFIYFCFESFKKSNFLFKYLYITPISLLLISSFLSGTRAVFVSYLLFIFFYLYFKTDKLKSISIYTGIFYLFSAIFTYLIINILPIIRSSSSFSEMYILFESFYNQYGFTFLKLQNSGELQTSINLQKLQHEIINNNQNYTYGLNLLNDLFVFIPRIFFENRPLPTSELFASKYYNDIYTQGGGMGMFVLIDGYWSFGNIGVFISCFLFSIFLLTIYNSISRSLNNNPTSIFIFIIYFQSFMISSVRGGMLLSIRSFFLGIFVFYLIALFSTSRIFLKKITNNA